LGSCPVCPPETIFTAPKPWPMRPATPRIGPWIPAQPSARTKPSGHTTAASPASFTAARGASSNRAVLGSSCGAPNAPAPWRTATATAPVWSPRASAQVRTAPALPAGPRGQREIAGGGAEVLRRAQRAARRPVGHPHRARAGAVVVAPGDVRPAGAVGRDRRARGAIVERADRERGARRLDRDLQPR